MLKKSATRTAEPSSTPLVEIEGLNENQSEKEDSPKKRRRLSLGDTGGIVGISGAIQAENCTINVNITK